MDKPINFKFLYVNKDGHAKSAFFRKKGRVEDTIVTINEETFEIADLKHTERRFNQITIYFQHNTPADGLRMQLTSERHAERVQRALIARASRIHAEQRKSTLDSTGQGHLLHTTTCPRCGATIDLSSFETSPQIYCDYCDGVFTPGSNIEDEEKLNTCDKCKYIGMPAKFQTVVLIFLLIEGTYAEGRKHFICHGCMRRRAWWMLVFNLPFVIGVPWALVRLGQAYFGGSARSRSFRGLDKANILARKGKCNQAARRYDDLAESLPAAAPIRLNAGMAWAQAERWEQAAGQLELALAECANYTPAARLLSKCYQEMGQDAEAKLIDAQFSKDFHAMVEAEKHAALAL